MGMGVGMGMGVVRRRVVSQAGVDLALQGVAVEVGHQADAERVGAVQALDDAQVAGRLGQALAEAQAAVVHRQGVGVEEACGVERGVWMDGERREKDFLEKCSVCVQL